MSLLFRRGLGWLHFFAAALGCCCKKIEVTLTRPIVAAGAGVRAGERKERALWLWLEQSARGKRLGRGRRPRRFLPLLLLVLVVLTRLHLYLYLGSSPPLIAHCRVAEQYLPYHPRRRPPPCWATTFASLEHALPQPHQRRRPRRLRSSLRLHLALGQQQLVPSIPPVAANHPHHPPSPRQRSPSLPTFMPSVPQWPSGQSTSPRSSEQA